MFEDSRQYTTLCEMRMGHFGTEVLYRYYQFFTPDNAILSHLFLEHSASLSVRETTDAWESKWLTARYESMTNASP